MKKIIEFFRQLGLLIGAWIIYFWTDFWNWTVIRQKASWIAYEINKPGEWPLGFLTEEKAVEKVSRVGSIRYLDKERGCIFYDKQSGEN